MKEALTSIARKLWLLDERATFDEPRHPAARLVARSDPLPRRAANGFAPEAHAAPSASARSDRHRVGTGMCHLVAG